MNEIEVSSIDLVEGGNVFKQGHYLTLGYIPCDESGALVDLTDKVLSVMLWGRKGIGFEADAVYADGVLRFTLNETIPAGEYNVEFTATSSTDATYRKKFPTSASSGRIVVRQSADDLGAMGVSVITAAQFRTEFDQAINALPVDSEINLARVATDGTVYPHLPARLDAEKQETAAQLAEKAAKTEVQSLVTNKAEVSYVDSKVAAVASGSPKGSYATLAALQTAFPTGTTGIYVVVSDNKWYYWSGSVWSAGGSYLNGGYYTVTETSETVNVFDKTKATDGGYYSDVSPYAWLTGASVGQSGFIPVKPGDVVRINPSTNSNYILVYKNSAGTIFASAKKSDGVIGTWSTVAPPNAVSVSTAFYLIEKNTFMITINNPMPTTYVVFSGGVNQTLESTFKTAATEVFTEVSANSNFKGKALSILGDSISTFTGWLPAGNVTFYDGVNYGVTNVNQTWWKRLIDQTGMTLCVNNSWSGSRVTTTNGNESSGSFSRATALHAVEKNPDVIIVYLGINDFNNEVPIGTYNGSTAFPTSTTTFREAYAVMLSKIMTQYKNAELYVCTLPDCERNGTTGFPEINDNGVLLAEWNRAIRELADLFGVTVIEMSKSGLTFYNKDVLTADGLHPKSSGMKLLGNKAIKTIDPFVKFSSLA